MCETLVEDDGIIDTNRTLALQIRRLFSRYPFEATVGSAGLVTDPYTVVQAVQRALIPRNESLSTSSMKTHVFNEDVLEEKGLFNGLLQAVHPSDVKTCCLTGVGWVISRDSIAQFIARSLDVTILVPYYDEEQQVGKFLSRTDGCPPRTGRGRAAASVTIAWHTPMRRP